MTRSREWLDRGFRGLSRRTFLNRLGSLGAVAAGVTVGSGTALGQSTGGARQAMTTASSYSVYVGSRTTRERNARGDGINVYDVDAQTGRWTHKQLVGDLVNPSFLALHPHGRFVYSVHGDLQDISAFSVDAATGRLTFLNRQSTKGTNPVHVSLSPSGGHAIVANHITSTVAVLPVGADGTLGPISDLATLAGTIGPHRVEQPFPKPHQVEFDPSGQFIAVPDKGLDCTFVFRLDAAAGKLVRVDTKATDREGAGPRHINFHPTRPFAYVVNELNSSVTVMAFDTRTGALTPIQVLSTLPDTYVANSRAAEIAVSRDGRFVYASNRGHDSVVTFAIDERTGRLTTVGWTPSGGKTPRFMTLAPDGRFLYVANEESDSIVAFSVEARSGALKPTGDTVKTGSPVCIIFGRPRA
jgi:6-phosphogluconolactonase